MLTEWGGLDATSVRIDEPSGPASVSRSMGRPRTNPKGPKPGIAFRLDPEVHGWLVAFCQRQGWKLTDAVVWALSGVRYLDTKLGERMEPLLREQQEGGDDVFTTLWKRLEESYARTGSPNVRVLVPTTHAHSGKKKPARR